MTYYCHLDSTGSLGNTNLQLYSLKKAADGWNELVCAMGESHQVDHLTERLAFITTCLGLSLSQLLGQNSPTKTKTDKPRNLLNALLVRFHVDRDIQKRLNGSFKRLLSYYGDIRHLGPSKHRNLDKLTVGEVDEFRRFAIEIWDLLIAHYKQDETNDLEDVVSVTDAVWFHELPPLV